MKTLVEEVGRDQTFLQRGNTSDFRLRLPLDPPHRIFSDGHQLYAGKYEDFLDFSQKAVDFVPPKITRTFRL